MNRDVVLGEWIRAVRTLSAAELLAKGVVAESHSAVRGLFGKHLILTGEIEESA